MMDPKIKAVLDRLNAGWLERVDAVKAQLLASIETDAANKRESLAATRVSDAIDVVFNAREELVVLLDDDEEMP